MRFVSNGLKDTNMRFVGGNLLLHFTSGVFLFRIVLKKLESSLEEIV